MDLGNIIYIVAIIAYFIYQMTRKKGGEELPENPESPTPKPEKGVTFEELLKEIRNAQNPQKSDPVPPAPKPIPIPEPKPAYRKKVEEPEDDEIKYYEGTFHATKKNPYQAYAEKKSIPSAPVPKLNLESSVPKKVNPYTEKLKNPKSVREAIVLAEILNRKHF
ncbi:MAG: hypothetical protein LPK25_03710 [Cyclobacteriaceae bacterium]|nr:hypothetical protein [Cyclobacteriaceae bacterium]